MYKKLLIHSFRALSRQKAYLFINIIGLAIGLACSLVIAVFIAHELSYDQFHENKDRIHRIVLHGKIGGQEIRGSWSAPPVGQATRDELPGVEDFLRLNEWSETVVRWEEKAFTEPYFIEADSSFFDFFSIPLVIGNKQTVLNEPNTLVLSETTAQKIFGDTDPVGQMMRIGTGTVLYKVSGIMQDIPENTHLRANMIGSFVSNPRSQARDWLSNNLQTYLKLYPGATAADVDARFEDLIIKYVGPEIVRFMGINIEDFLRQGNKYNYYLQPLTKIHLDPDVETAFKPANDPRYLWIFGSIGLLILIIAGINFMNLSTAQASRRAKEVGIKKVSGSSRGILMGQFMLETVFLSFISLLLAAALASLALPFLNDILGISLNLKFTAHWLIIPVMLIAAIIIGLFAGSYPAIYLSSFDPNTVLKGKVTGSRNAIKLRSILTVVQFAISIILIASTMIMHRQLKYMLGKDLGFDKEHVMVIRRAAALGGQVASFKEELKNIAGVLTVSASTAVPGHSNNNNGYTMSERPEESLIIQSNWVDYDFLETYGIQTTSGRFFDKDLLTDREACLINDRAVQLFGIENPLQARFRGSNMISDEAVEVPVLGTIADFHFESLRQDIGPYMIQFKHDNIHWGYVSIRLASITDQSVIADIEKVWTSFTSGDPMQYFFMDQDFDRMYQEEKRNARLSIIFTILAIVIASLGLYGLTAFAVAQRTKEIGVRKTFGASVIDIWQLISREILYLIGFATLIAWPLVYWVAGNWLQNYHYRISLNIMDFLLGFLIAVVIALTTTSYRTFRAASLNPSLSLRYE